MDMVGEGWRKVRLRTERRGTGRTAPAMGRREEEKAFKGESKEGPFDFGNCWGNLLCLEENKEKVGEAKGMRDLVSLIGQRNFLGKS